MVVSKQNTVDLEVVLSKFKLTDRYYLKLLSLLIFSAITNAFYSVNYVFAAADTGYRCKYSECEYVHGSASVSVINSSSIENRCSKYLFVNGTCSYDNIDRGQTRDCDEWVYDDSHSFVAEHQLGCQDWKRTLVGTVHSSGYMIGLLIMGPMADKLGRKKLMIFSGITAASMGLGRSITTSYWAYIALELFEGLLGDTYSSTFNLGVEMVTKENRVSFITLMTASTSLAGMLMALIAWAVPYWRSFLQAIYGPSLLFFLYIIFLDESVRWLLISGKKNDAKKVLQKAARSSKADLNDESLDNLECEKVGANTSLISLLKVTITSKTLLIRFLTCVCMWTAGLFNKYALLINSVELQGNKYVNYGLTTLVELPASFALAFVLYRYNRRIPLIVSFVLTGVFCLAQAFVPNGSVWMSTSLFLVGKFMATISYAIVYLYTSELFPTYTRNTMHALCSSFGRIASIIAPQTPLLIKYWSGLPLCLVGGMSLLTSVVVILMPDTADVILPDTVREAEAVGSKPDSIAKI